MNKLNDLLAQINGAGDEWIPAELIESLGQYQSPTAVNALIHFLQAKKSRTRSAAAIALGQISDLTAVPALIACLTDPWYEVRQRAATALAQLADSRAPEERYAGASEIFVSSLNLLTHFQNGSYRVSSQKACL